MTRVTDEMIARFLSWKLPKAFSPDGGIRFEREYEGVDGKLYPHEPTGTNLFDYAQAKAMLEHVLGQEPAALSQGESS
jgi:hypothetical protein